MKRFYAMFHARTMEFVRDRGTFFWNLIFPVILVFGFAFAFSGSGNSLFKIGVYGKAPADMDFMHIEQASYISYDATAKDGAESVVLGKLRRHELDMVIDFDSHTFWFNEKGRNTSLLRKLFLDDPRAASFREEVVSGEAVRYVDWFVPGAIGMNMLFSCLSGVGFVIVRYRKNGVLKRLRATPVSAFSFVLAQAASRFAIVVATSAFVFLCTDLFLHFMMQGSWAVLALVFGLGIVSMIALGLAFASRFRSEELASGVMNLITLPMVGLSGVFFSLEGAPAPVKVAAEFLPLTHVIDAARAVMLEGKGLLGVAPDLLFLAVFSVLFLGVAAVLFRWD